jgi:predicted RNA-binding protein with PIN domain
MTEADEAEPTVPTEDRPDGPLPQVVRARIAALASDAVGRIDPADLPAAVRRVATFAAGRRAKLAGDQIAAALDRDDAFRARVADEVRAHQPALTETVEAGAPPATADPVDVAAIAYLLRPPGWTHVVTASAHAIEKERRSAEREQASDQTRRLRQQLEAATEEAKDARRRHREQLAEMKLENRGLRHRLADARAQVRAADDVAARAVLEAEEAVSVASSSASTLEAEIRRLRTRVAELERDLAASRRAGRAERGDDALRARLLIDTLLETAQGLRRELALPPVEGAPADGVAAHVAEQGSRTSSGKASLQSDDPVLLTELLALPRVHLVVDGYNVTKSAWPTLSLERQRERLVGGLAPLVARSGAEVTVVFDAADSEDRPPVNRPRGVRVLFSPVGVIADDVIRELVDAEPQGRPLVVATSDQEVARDVARSGARVVAASALTRLLLRS